MTGPLMQDAVRLAVEALTAAGLNAHPTIAEEYAGLPREALSSPEYLWVEEIPGTTPHIRYSDRPSVQLIAYSSAGPRASVQALQRAAKALQDSQGVPLPSGGVHRVLTVLRPHYQPLQGLPVGVGRAVAQFEFILSTHDHWS